MSEGYNSLEQWVDKGIEYWNAVIQEADIQLLVEQTGLDAEEAAVAYALGMKPDWRKTIGMLPPITPEE